MQAGTRSPSSATADGTVAGLFTLPIRRSTIAIAKLVVFLGWAVGVAVLLTVRVVFVDADVVVEPGVWWSAFRARSPRALLPDLRGRERAPG